MANTRQESVAIVGGGITGLFCAYILAQNHKSVHLFEASNRLGGRIRTIRLKPDNTPAGKNWDPDTLEFCAEFGPMRLELDKQLLVKALLDHLKIEPKKLGDAEPQPSRKKGGKGSRAPRGAAAAYLIDFPPYASPTMSSDPKYELRKDEEGKSPLQLLQMAVLRVIAHLEISKECAFFEELENFKNDIKLASATHEDVEPVFVAWAKNLKPRHYWEIQRYGCTRKIPLYAIGFWNLLSDSLSHDAITKLRDLGTFYHLLPENPNAAEWLVWWLIGFGASEHLQGIFGGMECIVDKLVKNLGDRGLREDKELKTRSKVTAVRLKKGKFELFLNGSSEPHGSYDRVILALPKGPLEKIVHANRDAFKAEKEISSLLDSAFAFPMVKLFVVVKNRWWEETNRANRYATKVPTRELHYWKGHTKDSKQGLIMLYTDRPASSFWANYLPPEEQPDADWARNPQLHEQGGTRLENKQEERPLLPDARRERLIKKAVQYINENNLPDITERDVAWYGIRDWGREPFGGANHAWRPEREYWVVMRRLANIAERDRPIPSIHVCGEAYSDYHGFIEGSLRSAVYVLHCILRQGSQDESLKWLKGAGINVESTQYFEALLEWVDDLDKIPRVSKKESHLWNPRSSDHPGKDSPGHPF